MTPDPTTIVSLTAPSGVDGRAEVAVLNDSTSVNFVGWLVRASGFGGAAVRQSQDPVVEGHGAVFGGFFYGPRSWTMEILLDPSTTWALSLARYEKLCRAMNAMAADGTAVWIEPGPVSRQMFYRREQPPSDPDEDGKVLIAGICADPRIYLTSAVATTSPAVNIGNADSPYLTFTFTPTSNGTCVITNTTAGLGSPAVTLTVGTGYLTAGTPVTVNFRTGAVVQGGVSKPQAVVFPTSTWWQLAPGSNSWSVSNASSVSLAGYSAWI